AALPFCSGPDPRRLGGAVGGTAGATSRRVGPSGRREARRTRATGLFGAGALPARRPPVGPLPPAARRASRWGDDEGPAACAAGPSARRRMGDSNRRGLLTQDAFQACAIGH